MTVNLLLRALIKYLAGILLIGMLIFLPAGTLSFTNGWLFMGVLFIPMLIIGIVLALKNPELLEKRLDAKEKIGEQRTVIKLSALMFVAGFIVAGLSHRYNWLPLPGVISAISAAVFLFAYAMYMQVLRENTYLSRTIEVQKDQKVIDTGLYGIIRHPMYSATLLLFLSMPLVLGSVYALLIFCAYPFIIAKRIKSEEQFLEKELPGYTEYKEKVRYRLIPFIW